MSYMEWVLSLYDEYVRRYDERYPEEKFKFRNIRNMNWKNRLKLMYFVFGYIMAIILNVYGSYIKNMNVVGIGLLLTFVLPYTVIYTLDRSIDKLKKRIQILKDVLQEENLLSYKKILKLTNDTGSTVYKLLNSNLEKLVNLIISFLGTTLFINIINNITSITMEVILLGIVFILEFVFAIYSFLSIVPNNRITRKKNFHEMLLILLTEFEE